MAPVDWACFACNDTRPFVGCCEMAPCVEQRGLHLWFRAAAGGGDVPEFQWPALHCFCGVGLLSNSTNKLGILLGFLKNPVRSSRVLSKLEVQSGIERSFLSKLTFCMAFGGSWIARAPCAEFKSHTRRERRK